MSPSHSLAPAKSNYFNPFVSRLDVKTKNQDFESAIKCATKMIKRKYGLDDYSNIIGLIVVKYIIHQPPFYGEINTHLEL